MLASQNLIEFIQSFDVHDPNILIVHCCVSLVMEFPLSNNIWPDEMSDSFDNVNGKYLWNAEIPMVYCCLNYVDKRECVF